MNALRRNPLIAAIAAMLAVVFVVALMIDAVSWSTRGRADTAINIPVAIVNNDTIVTKPTTVAAGRELAAGLLHPSAQSVKLHWTLTDSSAAATGLADGTYDAVLTIPSKFSKEISELGGPKPQHGNVQITSNSATSALGALVATQVTDAAAITLGQAVTTSYLTTMYGSLDTLNTSLGQIHAGAKSLASGSRALGTGIASSSAGEEQLSHSLGTLATGSASLSTSLTKVAEATATVAGRSSATAKGAASLSQALAQLSTECHIASSAPQFCSALASAAAGGASFASGAAATASGASQIASGSKQLSAGGSSVAAGAAAAASGMNQLTEAEDSLGSASTTLTKNASSLASSLGSAASAVPSYTKSQEKTASGVASNPVTVSSTSQHGSWVTHGLEAIPITVAIIAWMIALAIGTWRARSVRLRAMSALPLPRGRLLREALVGALVLGAVAGITVWGSLALSGATFAASGSFALLMILGFASTCVVAAGLATFLPRAAVPSLAALFVVQIASMQVLLPVGTAPDLFQVLSRILPMPAIESLATATLSGGQSISVGGAVLCLVVWAVVGIAAGALGVSRSRQLVVPSRLFMTADAVPKRGRSEVGGAL